MLLTRPSAKHVSTHVQPPLCVDLDHTLIASDMLWESVCALLRQNFLAVFLLPLWLLRGKAYLKEQIAARVKIDASALPYRRDVLDFLQEEKANGRYLVLATASNVRFAEAVADHLDIFDEVIASDEGANLKGRAKLDVIAERFELSGFDYVGDSRADLPLWEQAEKAYLVQPSKQLLRQAQKVCTPERIFDNKPRKLRAMVKLMRPHQWVKNALLFVPLVLAHQFFNIAAISETVLAFIAFSFCASSVYILNDLLDLQADRKHPHKRRRPLASGTVPIPLGIAMCAGLLAAGLVLPLLTLTPQFMGILALYMVVTTAYSFRLKKEPILDVFVLAGLYTLRIVAGGVATGILVSSWLLAFAAFFFLSLALVKRYAELARAEIEKQAKLDHRGYQVEDLAMIQSVGPASGYMAVLTMCLYINAQDVLKMYHTPNLLWVICFVLFYWITRVWFLARRRELNEDPVVFACSDPLSIASGLTVVGVLLCAAA